MTNVFLTYYYNFTVDNPTLPMTVVLWALWAGIVFAVASSVYTRSHIGKLPQALLKNECIGTKNAMTAGDLEIKLTPGMRRALKDGKMLRKYVHIANCDECSTTVQYSGAARAIRHFFNMSETKTEYNYSKALLYIPDDKKYSADVRYESKGKMSTNIIILIATALIGAVVVIALMHYIPEILSLLDEAITLFKSAIPSAD